MVCKYCGKEIREGLIYCPFCGCRVAEEKRALEPEPEMEMGRKGKKQYRGGEEQFREGAGVWKKTQARSMILQACIVGGFTFVMSLWFSFYAVGFIFKSTLVVGTTVYAVLVTVLLAQIGGMTPSTREKGWALLLLCSLGIGLCVFLAAMICGNNVGQKRNFDSVMVYLYMAAPAIAWFLWVVSHWTGIRGLWAKSGAGKLGGAGMLLLSILVWFAGAASIMALLIDIL